MSEDRENGEKVGKRGKRNKLDYDPPGNCSTIRLGREEELESPGREVRVVMRAYHGQERILQVLSLAPGSVY